MQMKPIITIYIITILFVFVNSLVRNLKKFNKNKFLQKFNIIMKKHSINFF